MARALLALTLATAACASSAPPARRPPHSTTTAAVPSSSLPATTATAPAPVSTSSVQVARPPSTTPPVVAEGAAPSEGMPGQEVTLACIRHWESRGNYRAVSRSGRHRGAYQFDRSTWAANGGEGDPAEAAPDEQDRVASVLLARRGLSPWPTPARRCA